MKPDWINYRAKGQEKRLRRTQAAETIRDELQNLRIITHNLKLYDGESDYEGRELDEYIQELIRIENTIVATLDDLEGTN